MASVEEKKESDLNLEMTLKKIQFDIQDSFQRDIDKTESMINLTNILKDILSKEISLEEYFNNDPKLLEYFCGDFIKNVINYILLQPVIFGKNGHDIALDLFNHIFKLFFKFHKNKKYTSLFEHTMTILNPKSPYNNYFEPNPKTYSQIRNAKKKLTFLDFNKQFCSEFLNKEKESRLHKPGDEVDVYLQVKRENITLEQFAWIRGKILEYYDENNFLVDCPAVGGKVVKSVGSCHIAKLGSKTKDWEWRKNLKKYDVIDCFDRGKWYPATVMGVKYEEGEDGYQIPIYNIGFRLYPKHFVNPNDKNDKYKNYKCFWEEKTSLDTDRNKEEYLGDIEQYDESIKFFNKRIQKFQNFTSVQKKFLNSPIYTPHVQHAGNKIQKMTNDLENNGDVISNYANCYDYEKNGKKNYIIGKNAYFTYYNALLLKNIADDNGYEKLINIITDKPQSEEIYFSIYILFFSLSYLHVQFLSENIEKIEKGIINYINDLNSNEIRNIHKNFMDLISVFLKETYRWIQEDNYNELTEKKINLFLDELTLTLSLKMLKTSIFDKRLQGIKSLNTYITENKKDEKCMKNIIQLLKKNEILKEIFGPNYHSQIISKTNIILSLLLKHKEVNEEEIKLIWDCTQRGDLEAKTTIMKLLSDVAKDLNAEFIEILLQNIINGLDKDKITEKEIDFIYNLSIQGNNENNEVICLEYLYQCLLKVDLNEDLKKNPFMDKLSNLTTKEEKNISKILEMIENDLKNNHSSLILYQILSIILDRYTAITSEEIFYLKDCLKEFTKDEHLLNIFKNNFYDYIKKAKEALQNNKKEPKDDNDNIIIDNYSHVINIQKRINFLKDWIIIIYPNFDFVPFLKEVLLDNPISINDKNIFYEFIKKYLSKSDEKVKESEEKKKRKINIQNKLFQIFNEQEQNSMTMAEFKLFIIIFLEINNENIDYKITNNDKYEIKLKCENIESIKEMDKLWNIIFKIRDEDILNKAIEIIYNIYNNKEQLIKLQNKCIELIKDESTKSEIIDKCFKILKNIIIQSEKGHFLKSKSLSNLLRKYILHISLSDATKYKYINYDANSERDKILNQIIYGNTTISEIKNLLVQKLHHPYNYLSIGFSKEYIKKKKLSDDKASFDESYNNKSIFEILKKELEEGLPLEKILVFSKKEIQKVKLLERNKINKKFEVILKEWFKEFTKGTGKMDQEGVIRYIKRVTNTNRVSGNDDRIEQLFRDYDKEKKGYISEEGFIQFYIDVLKQNKGDTVWENLDEMGIRPDLHKKDEIEDTDTMDNNQLPRYVLGNDKSFLEQLFLLYNKYKNKNEIFEFLLCLVKNQEIYDDILHNMNKSDNNTFQDILNDNSKILEQFYYLFIIESFLQDISAEIIDYEKLFGKIKNEGGKKDKNIYKFVEEKKSDKSNSEKLTFLKEFITSNKFELLLNYVDKLLLEIKLDNENIALNLCFEKAIQIINTIYFSCFCDYNEEYETKNNKEIYFIDCKNLSKKIKEDNSIKAKVEEIKFLNLIKNAITLINNNKEYLSSNTTNASFDNMLKSAFKLIICLISFNSKLQNELDTNDEIKELLMKLILYSFTLKNEEFKCFFLSYMSESFNSCTNKTNKYTNLLFSEAQKIFNEIISSTDDNIMKSKSTVLFLEFFSVLSSNIGEESGNNFLNTLYTILFENLTGNSQKLSDTMFIGFMNILINRMKNNIDFKNEIIKTKINGMTLMDLIFEKFFKNKEDTNIISEEDDENEEENSNAKFIDLDTIKPEGEKKNQFEVKEIKSVCGEYIIESLRYLKEPKMIEKLIILLRQYQKKENGGNEVNEVMRKMTLVSKRCGHVGLKNLGCICYMNSILQQLYMVPTFRYAILGSDDHKDKDPCQYGNRIISDDNLLHQLQNMYGYLTYSEREDYSPKDFCFSYKDWDGNPTNPMMQQDSQEFYNTFCDKIENCMRPTKYKYIINDVFTGTTCSSVVCESCKHVSNRFEDFYNLALEVKNINNLNDSLKKMIIPEKIDDFKCDNCKEKVTINKRTLLCDLPNVLVIHLKRFYMNYEIERTEKINSRFEFPFEINLKDFSAEKVVSQIYGKQFESDDIYVKQDDYYNYELKGINIHMGSAEGGHYISFINVKRDGQGNVSFENPTKAKDEKENYSWLKFNDSHVSIFDVNDIEKECFGGTVKGNFHSYENFQNAYMLIYERKKKTPIRMILENQNNIKQGDNLISINKDNRKQIKKKYNMNRNNWDIEESQLYNLIFFDEEKKEYYKFIPFYNIGKSMPKSLYKEIMAKNEIFRKEKLNNEMDEDKIRTKLYEILIEDLYLDDFNVLSKDYTFDIKRNLLGLSLDYISSLVTNCNLKEESKNFVNSNTKIILEKLILPFANKDLDMGSNAKNNTLIILINMKLCDTERMERIYSNDHRAIFDEKNLELFSLINNNILYLLSRLNPPTRYKTSLNNILEVLQNNQTITEYPPKTNNDTNKTPSYYLYQILYERMLNDEGTPGFLLNKQIISSLLGKITSENKLCKNVIYDILLYLLKYTDLYNTNLFHLKKEEIKKQSYPFNEKKYLINSINNTFIMILFDEKIELLIILIKILQVHELKFTDMFNREYLSTILNKANKKNKYHDLIKVLFAILDVHDKYSFKRVNFTLGYPSLIVKRGKTKIVGKKEEEEEKKEDENDKNAKGGNSWPLFGERLIMEETNETDRKSKLKKHIYTYKGFDHTLKYGSILSILFPEEEDKTSIISESDRIKYIYELLKLCLIDRGSYCVFKYIYLLPSRSLQYNNLYEEMIDILEQYNKENNNMYKLDEIKSNAEKCIKRINYEVQKSIKKIKNKKDDSTVNINDYKLPEEMESSYIKIDKVEEFIGTNPNIIYSDIVKEEIVLLTKSSNMFLLRLEYFTKYKTIQEMKDLINNEKNDQNEIKCLKEDEENVNNSDDDDFAIKKIDISDIDSEIDGKDLMFKVCKILTSINQKIIIEDSSITNKKNVIPCLIRYILINSQSSTSDIEVELGEKNIIPDIHHNYYLPLFIVDKINPRNISNYLNLNVIRNDLSFLKYNNISNNISLKSFMEI